jgi:hypothetical protein
MKERQMKSTEFCYWLQGLFELATPTQLNAEQTDLIKRHLNMVFVHEIDPSYPTGQQDALNALHNAPKPTVISQTSTPEPVMRC